MNRTLASFLLATLLPLSLYPELSSSSADTEIRRAAVAGRFYSSNPQKLTRAIDSFLLQAVEQVGESPIALISPHAGYIFSGQITADAFRQAQNFDYELVVVLGPNHTTAQFMDISVYDGDAYETPLGRIQIDRDLARDLIRDSDRTVFHKPVHRTEHSIEVQLPFIQRLFPQAKLLPVVLGTADYGVCRDFAKDLAKRLRNRKVLIVASSDLSHYPPFQDARETDLKTLESIGKMDARKVSLLLEHSIWGQVPNLSTKACGKRPILVAMTAAAELGARHAKALSYANSGDSAVGSHDRVVGYGAVAFYAKKPDSDSPTRTTTIESQPPSFPPQLSGEAESRILSIARNTLKQYFESETTPLIRLEDEPFTCPMGVFVTFRKKDVLRGCIGHMAEDLPLGQAIAYTAMQAAFRDERFEPLQPSELGELDIEVSLVSPSREIASFEEIRLGTDGVILEKHGRSAVFLPMVPIEQSWDRDQMLTALAVKAGLPGDAWKGGAKFYTFQAVALREHASHRDEGVR